MKCLKNSVSGERIKKSFVISNYKTREVRKCLLSRENYDNNNLTHSLHDVETNKATSVCWNYGINVLRVIKIKIYHTV